jgi:hypothetical protein
MITQAAIAFSFLASVNSDARAAIDPGTLSLIESAVKLEDPDDAAAALRPVFQANVPQIVELAVEAARITPGYCVIILNEATTAAPDIAGEIVSAVVDIVPQCLEPAAGELTEELVPIIPLDETAENPNRDVASPSKL